MADGKVGLGGEGWKVARCAVSSSANAAASLPPPPRHPAAPQWATTIKGTNPIKHKIVSEIWTAITKTAKKHT